MAITHSQKLRKLVNLGKTITDQAGNTVVFQPRYDTDRLPWIRLDHMSTDFESTEFRFGGDQLQVKEIKDENPSG